MNINAQSFFTTEPEEPVRADAFVNPIYRPKDSDTEQSIVDFLERLDLPTNKKHVNAMASAVVAVKKADAKGSTRIAYPGDSAHYTKGQYGYRRVAVLLRDAGWQVSVGRVERLWKREGLKVPRKQPKKSRLWLNDGSCRGLRRLSGSLS